MAPGATNGLKVACKDSASRTSLPDFPTGCGIAKPKAMTAGATRISALMPCMQGCQSGTQPDKADLLCLAFRRTSTCWPLVSQHHGYVMAIFPIAQVKGRFFKQLGPLPIPFV